MSEHVDEFNKMISDLLNLNDDMKDGDKAILLLNSLPESYDHLSTTLLNGKDSVRFEDVSSALLGNEQRQREKCGTSSDALVTRGRTDVRKQAKHGSSRSKSRTRYLDNMECYKCKRKGHMKKNCPNDWVDKGKKKNADDTANSVTSADGDFESTLVVTPRKSSTDEWILDSGCSYHMCPNKDLFHTLTKANGGTVLMGNDHVCRTEGIGTVKLKLHDGVVRTNGCKIVFESGMVKVISSALVMMKENKVDNLYFL